MIDKQTGLHYPKANIKQNLNNEQQIKALQNCRTYISGKITGIEDLAKKMFAKAAEDLLQKGLTPVNPFEFNHDHDKSWESYMRTCIIELMKCDAIYMLPGWKKSRGAIIEHRLALDLDLMIIEIDPRSMYERKTDFAKEIGYNSIADAISSLGPAMFNHKYKFRKTNKQSVPASAIMR